MINRTILVGRLTKEPEIRKSASGTAVLNFTLAINEKYKNEEKTHFINCVTFNKTAEIISQYCNKGSLLGVDGKLNTRNYEKDGNKVYVTEVIADSVQLLGDKKASDAELEIPSSPRTIELNYGARPITDSKKFENDDDLPF